MAKVKIIYWSGTGNTEEMANQVAAGAKEAGADVSVFTSADFNAEMIGQFDAIAFGCPSMGAEELEETEFAPMFDACEPKLRGKKVALFGSYGWGDGQWMRDWEDRMKAAGATVVGGEGVICQETPDDEALENCKALGKELAALA